MLLEGSSIALKEQICWAIGNVAGDSDDFRSVLLANGCLKPLIKFLTEVATAVPTDASNPAQTVAWAISNVARGSTPASLFIESGN